MFRKTLAIFILFSQTAIAANHLTYYVISKQVDFNGTTHTRLQQTWQGYPIIGGDVVIHRSKDGDSVDGTMYQHINLSAPTNKNKLKAWQQATTEWRKQANIIPLTQDLKVYIDNNNKAHWVYEIRFRAEYKNQMPAIPVIIMDTKNFKIYEQWNDIKTEKSLVTAGGIGGNERTGKLWYDGIPGHRSVLDMTRDSINKQCWLSNPTVSVKDRRLNDKTPSFLCETPEPTHNNIYWNNNEDSVNGGYSPNMDALYSDMIVRKMYSDWFKIVMLEKDGKPMHVNFYTHDPKLGDNAYYENGEMYFGDGNQESYPVAAPSVVAHEMSHGFTAQHSNLHYSGQSGGLNESFSDMADKSLEYYINGKNNWEIDAELVKDGGKALRFMDEPTKDCEGRQPGNNCSISHINDYKRNMNVHFSSGIYNKVFVQLANRWGTRKAFAVMTQANMHYWTSRTNFAKAACGVIAAAKDYRYSVRDVQEALKTVGIIGKC